LPLSCLKRFVISFILSFPTLTHNVENDEAASESSESESEEFVSHVVVPSREELECSLLQRKKEELLMRYVYHLKQSEGE
jgi:sortase (surface protein transpeptidase)